MGYPVNRLKELRDSKNLTGVEVAKAANITPQYYYELEKGAKRLNEDLLRRFAKYYSTTTDYILCIDCPQPPCGDVVMESPENFKSEGKGEGLETIIYRAVKRALDERDRHRDGQ